jgi:hypothetical protein
VCLWRLAFAEVGERAHDAGAVWGEALAAELRVVVGAIIDLGEGDAGRHVQEHSPAHRPCQPTQSGWQDKSVSC